MSIKTYALTTRQRVIDFLELSSLTTNQQNLIDRLIDSVTEFIENYTGKRFQQTVYAEEVDGLGEDKLFVSNTPIASGESFSLQVRDTSLNENDWTTIDSNLYFIDYGAGVIYGAGDYKFIRGRRLYRINYTAGYDFDNSATFLSDTEAGDIEFAAWKLISTAYSRRKDGVGISSERLGDYSVTYLKTVFSDDDIKSILDGYKNLSAGGTMNPSHN